MHTTRRSHVGSPRPFRITAAVFRVERPTDQPMSATRAPGESFEAIVRANAFMTLATADAAGRPWASPVWFATDDCLQFIWASKPHARHSTNLALRPEISIAIFDSGQPPGTGLGVYMTARAELVP